MQGFLAKNLEIILARVCSLPLFPLSGSQDQGHLSVSVRFTANPWNPAFMYFWNTGSFPKINSTVFDQAFYGAFLIAPYYCIRVYMGKIILWPEQL